MQATAVILAAGLGTRMRSAVPKVLHRIAGRPMLHHLLSSCDAVFDRVVVVIGSDMVAVKEAAAPHPCVIQAERLGTAHAAVQAAELFGEGEVAVLYADVALIRPATLRRLLARRAAGDAGLVLLGMRPRDPAQYGRLIGTPDDVERVVEWADASPEERAVGLCNAGALCASAADMRRWLRSIRADNAKQEHYLTDAVALARKEGRRVAAVEAPADELTGINSRAELAAAEAVMQGWLRAAAMEAGVTMIDPASVFLCADTVLAPDVVLEPNVVFGTGVSVGRGTEILAFTRLEGCTIGEDCVIGPFARIRPRTVLGNGVHLGNFVELKAATLGAGVKANHLSYLGDTEIGDRTNIGAGTITCNYDGYAKHRTTIGARAFIGSNTAFVAPVRVGDGAMTAAGSVITDDVADNALAIARERQVEKPGHAAAFRERQQTRKR